MLSRKTKGPSTSLRAGFTLIELLVVIAIIAILAAILFPVFAKAREKARQSQCMSNLKNSSLALRMYSSDYDERLPQGLPANFNAGGVCTVGNGWCNRVMNPSALNTSRCTTDYTCGWAFESQAYIKNSQVLLCPNWNRVNLVGTTSRIAGAVSQNPLSNANNTQAQNIPAAGLANQYWVTTYMLSASLIGASEAEISNSANKAMLYEVLPYHHDTTVLAPVAGNNHGINTNNPKPGMLVIVGFADGHAKVQNMNQSAGLNTATSTSAAAGVCNGYNKWNLNAGWSVANLTVCNNVNQTPGRITGRQGMNF